MKDVDTRLEEELEESFGWGQRFAARRMATDRFEATVEIAVSFVEAKILFMDVAKRLGRSPVNARQTMVRS